ncbi:late competence protein ComER [Anaerobacillus isosaccharinicus]|uniref:Pyrroline-5-carboxylate reductase n=1 Tax=Anaerobacillus isosaccharinicus TaxID=1532552 RepID=A0A1S2LR90_9BACI|nr:late competence protein ComER [Anaerobacillus isosaccharinicus]MBA5585470.1 late competence protein ComER [Anaerobacillus isosaccharinicus]QOY36213.1 late competence protein ComER [Anaerobacillus isosaccharinicus]
MKIGIIGTGSMGSILIESFIESTAVTPSQLIITNRTIEKAYAFKEKFPDLQVVESSKDVARAADILFICVKPLQFQSLLKELNSVLTKEQLLISITSPISISQLESAVSCKTARIIPSITNRALAGTSLVTLGTTCNADDYETLNSLLRHISTPVIIEENITRVASDIASCGPAFFSYLVQGFIEAAVRQTEITKEEATQLASEMMIGFGKLLEKEIFTLPTLQERVSVPGGVTGEGIKVLREELGDMFDLLFQQTHAKYDEDLEKVKDQFNS